MDRPAEGPRDTRQTPRVLVLLAGVLLAVRIVVGIVEKQVPPPTDDAVDAMMDKRADHVTWVSPDSADSLAGAPFK